MEIHCCNRSGQTCAMENQETSGFHSKQRLHKTTTPSSKGEMKMNEMK